MNGPRITNEDRGITINKSLAWTMVIGLIGAGLWLGNEIAYTRQGLVNLSEEQTQRHAETLTYRRDVEQRLRQVEASRVGDGAEIAALRRDVNELRPEIRELTSLIRRLEAAQRFPR